jgi:hypothetical protein
MKLIVACLALAVSSLALAQDEISLFDGKGRAAAYIVTNDELVIYLWLGEPVAYLVGDSGRDFHVYGFNGKHLGWFVDEIVRAEDGNVACALKGIISNAQLEPLKGLKALKPLKSLKELAPLRPLFSRQWGELPCRFFMKQGES